MKWLLIYLTATKNWLRFCEAEDLVQDVMLRLWNNQSTISIQTTLSAYLAVTVKYEVINYLAKQKRYAGYVASEPMSNTDHGTENLLKLNELQVRLAKLVKFLPEKCQWLLF